ncbi:MAG: adenosylcobinamide-GDP ribazoletransferase [Cyanophyceae cyanobacterium]
MQNRNRWRFWGQGSGRASGRGIGAIAKRFGAAVLFYTVLPLPQWWATEFRRIALLAPAIGVAIGAGLGALDWALAIPVWVRSAVVIGAWVWVTGGLHLDGVMDTADGLGVRAERRLAVMADSVVGAFGAIALGILLLLKITALGSLEGDRWIVLMAAAGWGRWGQLMAIARYPYLKAEGKGKFHRDEIQGWREGVVSGLGLLALGGVLGWVTGQWGFVGALSAGSGAIALGAGAWFNRRLGGHTGDTYGAVVEWTEALILVLGTCLAGYFQA